MSNKLDLLKNFSWLALGFAASCSFSPIFNGKSLIDLGIDWGIQKHKQQTLPCVETNGKKLAPPFDALACK